ncbi:MAG: DNA-directed RNA polymerase subunit omega [candidate division Zixibacteria bacterium]|nr:DNA-directed RNA polymerase subunit omega [candidate division Zixibacteria bacterium]
MKGEFMDTKMILLDKLDGIALNRYQAVLLAAKRARQINEERLAAMQMMTEDSEEPIDYRKVTTIALEQLLNGDITLKKKEN